MKRILITGANSYIGTSFEKYMSQFDEYQINTLDVQGNSWKNKSFCNYDAILHVAGIAHIKETDKNKHLYYKINRDLTIDIAKKAKQEGVKQFVFLSSMSVYGMTTGVITHETLPCPKSNYGKSKLEAEQSIITLRDDTFKIAVLRPPMVYGDGCKGNYQALKKFAIYFPIFPDIKNKRSMIFIETLCKYIKEIIDIDGNSVFYPQDDEYVCTTEMVKAIAKEYGKNIKTTKLFNLFIQNLHINLFKKIFGNLTYCREMSDINSHNNV